jgi:hypothetical protein
MERGRVRDQGAGGGGLGGQAGGKGLEGEIGGWRGFPVMTQYDLSEAPPL